MNKSIPGPFANGRSASRSIEPPKPEASTPKETKFTEPGSVLTSLSCGIPVALFGFVLNAGSAL